MKYLKCFEGFLDIFKKKDIKKDDKVNNDLEIILLLIKNNDFSNLKIDIDDKSFDTKTTYRFSTKLGDIKVVDFDLFSMSSPKKSKSYVVIYIDGSEVGRSNKTSNDIVIEIFNLLSRKKL